jgi:hypothetical protein
MGSTDLLIIVALFLAGFWAVVYTCGRYDLGGWSTTVSGIIATLLTSTYFNHTRCLGLLGPAQDNDLAMVRGISFLLACIFILLSAFFWMLIGVEVKMKQK